MPEYRAYFIGSDDRIAGFEAFEASDDQGAIELAGAIGEPREIELWCGPRFVTKIRPKPE
jgi:hypothetical protein